MTPRTDLSPLFGIALSTVIGLAIWYWMLG